MLHRVNTIIIHENIQKSKSYSKEEIAALTEVLGVEDWSKITVDEFNAKITELNENGTLKSAAEQIKRVKLAKEAEATVPTKALPHRLSSKLSEGAHHYILNPLIAHHTLDKLLVKRYNKVIKNVR